MDNLKPEHRRKNMQNIRSTNTQIEIAVRSLLHKKGHRFRKNAKNLYGKPDIVFPKNKAVVFLDSCFWHSCPYHSNIPYTNQVYWIPKLNRNKQRDKEVNRYLRKNGWTVLRFWEHQVKKNIWEVISKIETHL
ncbi:MAG: very short patch repair endonuclease [Ignavibacteriales bacterium UTCHB2]|nr:very short patch repair endonuclease [Ignavibacteriales bacterium]OQY76033.1 MAG: very short patch repair endonuclease [Ignavibacteriales bacterium UTCHB2]